CCSNCSILLFSTCDLVLLCYARIVLLYDLVSALFCSHGSVMFSLVLFLKEFFASWF
ncbi:hypothetical protein A2U01_0090660, partial [Trifolium medium]|nr:hypothetical protein [Trifolium medium]